MSYVGYHVFCPVIYSQLLRVFADWVSFVLQHSAIKITLNFFFFIYKISPRKITSFVLVSVVLYECLFVRLSVYICFCCSLCMFVCAFICPHLFLLFFMYVFCAYGCPRLFLLFFVYLCLCVCLSTSVSQYLLDRKF